MRRIMIHGSCHTGRVWQELALALAARGTGYWETPNLSDYAPIPSFEQGAALLEQHYPGPKLVITHSMGALTGMRLALTGSVKALIGIAPVGDGLRTLLRAYWHMVRYTGRAALKFDRSGGQSFPIAHPGLGQMFYNPRWPVEMRERLRGQLVPEPYRVKPLDMLHPIPMQICPPIPALVVAYDQDKAVGSKEWPQSVARWLHCEVVRLKGAHNEFEAVGGAAALAEVISSFMHRYNLFEGGNARVQQIVASSANGQFSK